MIYHNIEIDITSSQNNWNFHAFPYWLYRPRSFLSLKSKTFTGPNVLSAVLFGLETVSRTALYHSQMQLIQASAPNFFVNSIALGHPSDTFFLEHTQAVPFS